MNIYGDRIFYNAVTGETLYIEVDNEWVLANKSNRILLSLSKEQIIANGIDATTLTAQLTTPLLIDGSTNNLTDSHSVDLVINEELFTLVLVNGVAHEVITAVNAGTYVIRCTNDLSNEVTVGAI